MATAKGSSGGSSVGGVEASVTMDTTQIDPGLAALRAGMDRAGADIDRLAAKLAGASTSTTRLSVGMEGIQKSGAMATHRLTVLGQTLDDLQYVGEMGLRPIINNLMQISPAAGIAAIAADQLIKHNEELAAIVKSVGEYWLGSMEQAAGGTKTMLDAIEEMKGGLQSAVTWIKELGEGWDALMGKPARLQREMIERYTSEGKPQDKAAGRAMSEAIDEYGRDAFLDEAVRERAKIDPALSGPGSEDAVREEKARLLELLAKARKGDRDALFGLRDRSKGTGLDLEDFTPEALERQEQERLERRGEHQRRLIEQEQERKAAREREALTDAEKANAEENDDNFRKYLKDKIDRGEALTEGERASAPKDLLDAEADKTRTRAEKAARAGERKQEAEATLEERMQRVRDRMAGMGAGPVRSSQVMDSASLIGSVQSSVTNEDPQKEILEETKEMHKEIAAIRKEFAKLQQPVTPGGK